MITETERQLLLRVLETCDPATDCGIGNDEIGEARDIVDRIGQQTLPVKTTSGATKIPRLTDAELADVGERVLDGRCALCNAGLDRDTCPQCEGTGAFSLKTEVMQSIIAELLERRASELPRETP